MIIIIDGYNYLKFHNSAKTIDHHTHTQFLHQLSRYGRLKKHKMIVVFDGGRHGEPSRQKVKDVTVIYSGKQKSADEVIMEYIDDHHHKDLLLVSSDHELNLFASTYDIISIGVDAFWHLLNNALEKKRDNSPDVPVFFDESETDFDTVMEQATKNVPLKQDDIPKKNVSIGVSRFSKHDRVLIKKLKKL